jgi:multiple sugar transport system permease protein
MNGTRAKPKSKETVGYYFVAPVVVFLAATIVFPLFYAFKLSFYMEDQFVGLQLFSRAFGDSAFWNAFWNTVYFTFWSVAFHLIIGMILALLLNEAIKGRIYFRILLLVPWMIAPVVTGIIWRWILNTQYGVVNDILIHLSVIKTYIPWLTSLEWSLPSVTLANIWSRYPFVMIMILAGLQAIPDELYEAASVDGASALQKFNAITLPHLKYILVLTTLLDAVYIFRLFDLAAVMTFGGPARSSEVLSLLVFRTAFVTFDFNYSSALAVLVFAVSFCFSIVYVKLVRSN